MNNSLRYCGIAVLGAFLYLTTSTAALAQGTVAYDFTTDVPGFTGGCPACFFEGQPVSGSFIYDPNAELFNITPNGIAVYRGGILEMNASVGGKSFADAFGIMIVGDNAVQGTRDILRFTPGINLEGFNIAGFELVDVRFLWMTNFPAGTPDFLTGLEQPAELPDIPGVLILDFINPISPGTTFSVNFENLLVTLAPIEVTMDIKPGSAENSINPGSKGVITVAILSTDTFDALQVDPLSVLFGVLPTPEAHAQGHIEDVDDDGDADLVLHFRTQETDITCGETEVYLSGETYDGLSIVGTDAIATVGCK